MIPAIRARLSDTFAPASPPQKHMSAIRQLDPTNLNFSEADFWGGATGFPETDFWVLSGFQVFEIPI